MDLQQLLNMLLGSNPKWARKLESFTGQPADYSIECLNNFLKELNKGPGLKKPEDKLQLFNSNYQLVLGLGCFKDYEAQILAADMSGYSLAEITQHFRINLKWDTNVNEVEQIYKDILPKFKEVGKHAGLFKEENPNTIDESIPNLGGQARKDIANGQMDTPPWKVNSVIDKKIS